ncbi:MAG: Uma2 family endonuclease [Cyanobacteria bacterium]|jgi:Uma2 family endonuclease|nr:Uma2 family endonuclease [Cyanobacteria bacterium GSL.Bin21]
MLINSKLPLDRDRLHQQDQTLSLAGMTWMDYEQFNSEESPGYRVSYFNGVITLVSPSKNHERIAQTIAILVSAYCRKYNVLYFPLGSTRLENQPLAGKEPDVSFAFNSDKDFPDLAIEVIFSSGRLDDLEKYQALGVPEVWFWRNNQVTFYQLQTQGYRKIDKSLFLSNLTSQTLTQFTNQGLSESPLVIETEFWQQI